MGQMFNGSFSAWKQDMQAPAKRNFAKWHGFEPAFAVVSTVAAPQAQSMGFKVYKKTSNYNRVYKRKNRRKRWDIMDAMMTWSYSVMHRSVEVIANAGKRMAHALDSGHHYSQGNSYNSHVHHENHRSHEAPKVLMHYEKALNVGVATAGHGDSHHSHRKH